MRHGIARRGEEDEGESVFVSMTDMTVSVLFIVMILLAFFASQYRREDRVPRVELLAAEAARDVAGAERDAAASHVAELEALLAQARARLREIEPALAAARKRVEALAQEVAALAARVAALQQENAVAVAARDEAQTRAEALAVQLEETRLALESAREALAALELEREQLVREAQDLRAERDRLLARLRNTLEDYLRAVDNARAVLLERLRAAIKAALLQDFPDLDIVVSNERDALRFQGGGLFDTNKTEIRKVREPFVQAVARALDEALPCYTIGPRAAFDTSCNPSFALVEAVQIEGHTDAEGDDAYNLLLSAQRAVATHRKMVFFAPGLTLHGNLDGEPVLSVAGYGEGRPVDRGDDDDAKARNRRIDLRFIMLSPRRSDEIAGIRERLLAAARESGQ